MNTIYQRRNLIDEKMKEFEVGRDMAFVAGFYSSLIRAIAGDKLSDTEFVVKMLKDASK